MILGGRCHIARTVVEDGGKVFGFWLAIDVFLGGRCHVDRRVDGAAWERVFCSYHYQGV